MQGLQGQPSSRGFSIRTGNGGATSLILIRRTHNYQHSPARAVLKHLRWYLVCNSYRPWFAGETAADRTSDPAESQAETYRKISRNFIESWNNGIDADMPTFLSQFSPTVDWHDHAFFIRHKGLGSLAPFRTSWLTAIKNFHCDIKSIRVVEDGAVIQCLYHGTMVGALPSKKASGRTFAANVLIMLGVNEDNKIQKVDEYYSATLDEAQDIQTYKLTSPPERGPGKL